jgi:hypothetical protein
MFHVKHFGKVDAKILANLHTSFGLHGVGFSKRAVRTAAFEKFEECFAWTQKGRDAEV